MSTIENAAQQPRLDAWRKALDALIACAPANGPELSAQLFDAARKAGVIERKPRQPSDLQRRLVAKLIFAGEIHSEPAAIVDAADRFARVNELGFSLDAPAIGEPRPHRPADRTASAAFPRSQAPAESVAPATAASAASDPAPQLPLSQPRDATRHEPAHSAARPVSRDRV